ncbi:helix-turn-helix transcriptional regulator, partial [Nocardia sp. NPDC003345]
TKLQIDALTGNSWLALTQGLPDDAAQMLDECVSRWPLDPSVRANWRDRAESDIGLPAPVEYAWGLELFARRDARAVDVLCRARAKFDVLGEYVSGWLSEQLATIAAGLLGAADRAHEISRRFAHRADASSALWEKSWAGLARSVVLTNHGDPVAALLLQKESLAYQLTAGDRWSGMWAVQFRIWSLARVLSDRSAESDHDRARALGLATDIAHLVGGLTTLRTELGINIDALGPFADQSANAIAIARRVLGAEAYGAAEARGVRLRPELDEVQKLALRKLTLAPPPDHRRKGAAQWTGLTRTEQEVAVLVAAGRTNGSIAARRGRSIRTIDAQVASILHKLGVTSREEIAEHVPSRLRESLMGS